MDRAFTGDRQAPRPLLDVAMDGRIVGSQKGGAPGGVRRLASGGIEMSDRGVRAVVVAPARDGSAGVPGSAGGPEPAGVPGSAGVARRHDGSAAVALGAGDDRVVALLEELADLGRRIGCRARELARLALDRADRSAAGVAPGASVPGGAAAALAAAAAELASGAATVVAAGDRPPRAVAGPSDAAAASPRLPVLHARRASPSSKRASSRSRRRAATPGLPRRARSRSLAALAASCLAHALALVALGWIAIAVEAEPVRVALTLGESAEAGADAAGDDVAAIDLVPLDDQAPEEDALEDLAAEQVAVEQVAAEEPAFDPAELLDAAAAPQLPAALDGEMAAPPAAGAVAQAAAGGAPDEGERADRRARRPARGAAGQAATFFGRSGAAGSVCFLCDNSNSYRDGGFHRVLEEIARAIDGLGPGQSFSVIFFSDTAYPLFHPEPAAGLVPATPENKRRARQWLGTVEMCRGGQGIHDAVRIAAGLDADALYLLSDGELGAGVVQKVAAADLDGTVVHTFGLQQNLFDRRRGGVDPDRLRDQQARNDNLLAIAAAHRGTFTPVTLPPVAAALERLRPIPRNRSRGPVWGLKL